MTNQVATRKCPDCLTIFRHRGQERCPHCGHGFGVVQREQRVEAPPPPPLPTPEPPPPAPPPTPAEPAYGSASELDALLLPYSENAAYRPEPPAPVVEAPVESTIPPFELPPEPQVAHHEQPRVPIPGTSVLPAMDPVDEALAGQHLVPADARHKIGHHRSRMPWYLRRETLIGLALVALVLLAVIVQLAS